MRLSLVRNAEQLRGLSSNWMELQLLLNFLLLGNIASSLIRDARRARKLNQTQVQICCLMIKNIVGGVRQPMTPQRIAQRLCLPASRVVPQLIALTHEDKRLVSLLPLESSDAPRDLRLRFYSLTKEGVRCAEALVRDFAAIESALMLSTSRKTEDAIERCCRNLASGLHQNAFENLEGLRDALKNGGLSIKRYKKVSE